MGRPGIEAAYWGDVAERSAERHRDIHHHEIRVDVHTDRKFILTPNGPRSTGRTHVAGIGVRAFHHSGTGYAHTNEFDPEAVRSIVEDAARMALASHRTGAASFPPEIKTVRKAEYRPVLNGDPFEMDNETVYAFLRRAMDAVHDVVPDAKAQTSFGIKNAVSHYTDSAGSRVHTGYANSTLLVQTVLRRAGRIGDSNVWAGGERGIHDYSGDDSPEALGEQAGHLVIESLDARGIPAGRYRALCDPGLSGLIAHESFGHLTEYDLVASAWSVLKGRLGARLAAPGVTIRDAPVVEGTPDGIRVPYDHEGTPGRTVTLLDDGVLNAYMHARDSAPHDQVDPTGNARAININHPPIVRMRNTYIEPGRMSLEETLEALGDGVYLIGGRGGAPRADGSFMFTAERGYEVKNGEITTPLKMASIYGNVLDFLGRVEGLSDRHEIKTNYFGGCGKWDQSFIHVGTGGPDVLVSEALVGGQGA